ncbi:helix-turn-helix domain-containing protein [Lachnospiraceae bacterium LCP25S3_G4]
MNDILRDKRKSLGLTQEQVASYLGITAPALNKWEKGLSCPDIALLPALACLMKTDPNTLLCFKENLSD